MKICVLVKPIIDSSSIQWNYRESRLDYVEEGFHSADIHALQWACDYKKREGAFVTVYMVADTQQEIRVDKLLKYSIDDCVLLRQESLSLYPNEVANILAKVIKTRSFDLILSGSISKDMNKGVTSAMLAEYLAMPVITHVHEIEPCENNEWRVKRKEGRGIVHNFQIKLPAVIGVLSSISRKRYIPRFSVSQRKTELIEIVSTEKISSSSSYQRLRMTEPKPNIIYLNLPSNELSAQKRQLINIGLSQGQATVGSSKMMEKHSEKLTNMVTHRILKWLKED